MSKTTRWREGEDEEGGGVRRMERGSEKNGEGEGEGEGGREMGKRGGHTSKYRNM